MKTTISIVTIAAISLMLLAGCKNEEPQVETAPATTNLSLEAQTGSSSKEGGPLFAFLGSAAEIENVVVTVTQGEKPLLENYLLTRQGAIYHGTLTSLPMGPTLVFSGAGLNASGKTIFSGKVTATLTADTGSISLILIPLDDGQPNLFPFVLSVTTPKEVILNQSETVTAIVQGQAGETLQCEFISPMEGGFFTPSQVLVTLAPGATQGQCSSSYTAPAVEGTYAHEVKVTNNQTNATQVGFSLVAVYEKKDQGIEVAIAPTLDGITAKVGKGMVTLTANASDDGPASELCFTWSLNGSSAVFSEVIGNQATINPYDGNQYGNLVVTVRDKNCTGLSSSLTYSIVRRQWVVK